MRALLVAAILCVGFAPLLIGQERMPRGYLYRGPLYQTRPATLVEPEGGLPLEFTESFFGNGALMTSIRSRTVRTVPVSGITIRAAFGPTTDGMMSFRMRADALRMGLESPVRITPDRVFRQFVFRIAAEDPHVPFRTPAPPMKIVFTLERVETGEGFVLFENPDAMELLWEALGRPSLTQQ